MKTVQARESSFEALLSGTPFEALVTCEPHFLSRMSCAIASRRFLQLVSDAHFLGAENQPYFEAFGHFKGKLLGPKGEFALVAVAGRDTAALILGRGLDPFLPRPARSASVISVNHYSHIDGEAIISGLDLVSTRCAKRLNGITAVAAELFEGLSRLNELEPARRKMARFVGRQLNQYGAR
jgi:hypothetical protein